MEVLRGLRRRPCNLIRRNSVSVAVYLYEILAGSIVGCSLCFMCVFVGCLVSKIAVLARINVKILS